MKETIMETGEPLAYHLTWTTYASWLPGDARGWVDRNKPGIQRANPHLEALAKSHLVHPPVILDAAMRRIVEDTIRKHCEIRGWLLHAVNVRSNHVHVLVTAQLPPDQVMNQLKAWSTRKLREQVGGLPKVLWTEGGSKKRIFEERYLQNTVEYVVEGQGD